MKISEQTESQVLEVFRRLVMGMAEHDQEAIASLLHSGFTAYWPGERAQIKDKKTFMAHITDMIPIILCPSDTTIKAVGTIAWISSDCSVSGTDEKPVEGHLTAIFTGTGFTWELVHFHLCLTTER